MNIFDLLLLSRARLNQMIDQRVALRTAELEDHLQTAELHLTLLGERISAVEAGVDAIHDFESQEKNTRER